MVPEDPELNKILQQKAQELISKKPGKDSTPIRPQLVTLTSENFSRYVSGQRPLVVDFWAVWCGPCRIMLPIFERVAGAFHGKAVFGRLNVDDCPEIASRHSIFSIPTFIIFREGRELDRLIGAVPQHQFLEFLTSNM